MRTVTAMIMTGRLVVTEICLMDVRKLIRQGALMNTVMSPEVDVNIMVGVSPYRRCVGDALHLSPRSRSWSLSTASPPSQSIE